MCRIQYRGMNLIPTSLQDWQLCHLTLNHSNNDGTSRYILNLHPFLQQNRSCGATNWWYTAESLFKSFHEKCILVVTQPGQCDCQPTKRPTIDWDGYSTHCVVVCGTGPVYCLDVSSVSQFIINPSCLW